MNNGALQHHIESSLPLGAAFYQRDALIVAPDLLGKILVVGTKEQLTACELVEVEAYLGNADSASHAYRGPTARNAPMFAGGGICYIYLIYGMYLCMNVVTGGPDSGQAVLLRAGRPLIGLETMAQRRRVNTDKKNWQRQLLSGPGKLVQGLGVRRSHNFQHFNRPDFKIVDGIENVEKSTVMTSSRIGISKATDLDYRFFIANSPWISGQR